MAAPDSPDHQPNPGLFYPLDGRLALAVPAGTLTVGTYDASPYTSLMVAGLCTARPWRLAVNWQAREFADALILANYWHVQAGSYFCHAFPCKGSDAQVQVSSTVATSLDQLFLYGLTYTGERQLPDHALILDEGHGHTIAAGTSYTIYLPPWAGPTYLAVHCDAAKPFTVQVLDYDYGGNWTGEPYEYLAAGPDMHDSIALGQRIHQFVITNTDAADHAYSWSVVPAV